MGKRSELSVPQRREAVLTLLRREEPAAKLARRFGVSEQTLNRWRDDFLVAGETGLAGGKNGIDKTAPIAAASEARAAAISITVQGTAVWPA